MKRRLSLTREQLTELTPDDLSAVAGGGPEETSLSGRTTQQVTFVLGTVVRTTTCYC